MLMLIFTAPQIAQQAQHACIQIPAGMNEMISESRGVVHARVLSSEVYYNQEQTLSYNHYVLQVIQVVKGKLPETITLVTENVQLSGMDCPTLGHLPQGAEIIACLERIPSNWECGYTPRFAYAPFGNMQGLFVVNEADGSVTDAYRRFNDAKQLYAAIGDAMLAKE